MFLVHYFSPWFVRQIYNVVYETCISGSLQIYNVVYETKICFWFIIFHHGLCGKFITWFMRQVFFWFSSVQHDLCDNFITWFMRQMCFCFLSVQHGLCDNFIASFIRQKYVSGSSAFIMVCVTNLQRGL